MTTPSPGQAGGTGAASGPRVALAVLGAVAAYFLLVFHSPADPIHWGNRIPDNDAEILEIMKESIPTDLDRKLFEDHITKLDRAEYGAGARKLHEFVMTRYPHMTYVVAGVLIRRSGKLLQEGKIADAEVLARGAATIAERDFRAWEALLAAQRAAGDAPGAVQSEKRMKDLRVRFPYPSGADYALGIGAPLLAGLFFWLVAPRVLPGGGGAGATTPAGGPTTMVGVAAPKIDTAGADAESGATGQTITRVLGAEGRLDQAQLLLECGEFDAVLPVFKKTVELNPASSKKIATICIEEGRKHYEAGNLPSALRCFQLAIDHEPTDIRAQTFLANCMVKQGNFQAAVEHYLEVCSIDPQGAIGFYNLGICYEKTAQHDSAVKAFEHALRLDPKMANAHYYLAKVHETSGNGPKAVEHWRQVATMLPNTPQAQKAQERIAALGG